MADPTTSSPDISPDSSTSGNVVDWYSKQPAATQATPTNAVRDGIAARLSQQRQDDTAAQQNARPAAASSSSGDSSDDDAGPSYLDQAKRKAYEALQGLGGSFHNTNKMLNTLAGAVPVALDKIHSHLSGNEDTRLQDAWFRSMVDPLVAQDSAFQLGPDATFADKAAHAVGAMSGQVAQAVLLQPRTTELDVLKAANNPKNSASCVIDALRQHTIDKSGIRQKLAAVGGTVGLAGAKAIKALTAPAANDAVDKGREVLNKTGDQNQAVHAGVMHYLLDAMAK